MSRILITPGIQLEAHELIEKHVRSRGPGGQNINKVSSAVQLRFDVAGSPSLPARIKRKILESGDARLSKDGVLVIFSDGSSSQEANRRAAMERLRSIIRDAARIRKVRRKTLPTAASVKRRLDAKARRSRAKKIRSGKIDPD